jgi:Short-chain dehydrogenases of various substrate specificities
MVRARTVVITGASAGIGAALAHEFAGRGYALGLAARRRSRLEAVRADIRSRHTGARVELAELDVDRVDTVESTLSDLFERLGGVDVFIANAGINRFTRVGRGELADELAILQTNVLGAVACLHAASAHLKARGAGRLVGISSLAAENAVPKQAAYCASKSALSMYLAVARRELARDGVGVTTLLPGFVKTEIMEDIGKYPFAVTAEQAAREMADLIEDGADVGVVPRFPWRVVRPFFNVIPARVYRWLK